MLLLCVPPARLDGLPLRPGRPHLNEPLPSRPLHAMPSQAKHGVSTLVPEAEADLSQIFQHIMEELGFNVFKDSTREFFVVQVTSHTYLRHPLLLGSLTDALIQ